ncbi:MAG: recombinase RecT [Burkholderiales bacterium]|nr:MAG: recombinase RecT [Burkholderiales bacterium]
MSTSALRAAATGKAAPNPLASFSSFMDKFKPQLSLALPKHLTADRMARLALTAFSTTPALQKCDPRSIAAAVMTAGQLGLEIGVNGQGFLVPYGTTCTFVPGWKGLQDLVNRSGRATSWTGAVFEGDEFDYQLGDSPYVHHRPGDEDDPKKLTHVYAVGRVNGSNWPIVEVWTMAKVWKHRDQYNKVGQRHYSFRDQEMYARKVPLLQVLKYLPSSVELSNALAVANAAEVGQRADILEGCVSVSDIDGADDQGALTGADFVQRVEQAADHGSAEAILQQALAYGLPPADAAAVEKAFAKKWPSAAQA